MQTLTKNLLNIIKWFWFKLVLPVLIAISKIIKSWGKILTKDRQFTIVLLITIALIIGLFFFCIVPTSQNFEGNLLVSSLSFTSQGSDRLFLKNVRKLREITISGKQKFTLVGTFNSSSHPEINQLDQLEIELPSDNSYLTITPTDDFTLEELRLQQQTRINNLKYAFYTRRLSFTIIPPNSSESPQFIFNPNSPLKITLSDYKIAKPSLTNNNIPLEFNLETTQFQLQPTANIQVNLQLPENKKPVFWGNINVSNVEFEQLIQAGDKLEDNIIDSTIIAGEIRMAKQKLKLENKQFLIVNHPGIQTINRLQIIQPDSSENLELKTTAGNKIKLSQSQTGLEISISGNTNSIKAGLNPRLTISQIQGSLISRYVSNDVIVAIISFSAGLIVSLFSWLFNNFPDSSRSNN